MLQQDDHAGRLLGHFNLKQADARKQQELPMRDLRRANRDLSRATSRFDLVPQAAEDPFREERIAIDKYPTQQLGRILHRQTLA